MPTNSVLTIDEVASTINTMLADPNSRTVDARWLLMRLSSQAELVRILRTIVDNRNLASEVAAHSYPHLLGFDKYVLLSCAHLGQLRLHVWWPDQQRTREDVHDHRFSFSSAVVKGRIRSQIYQTDPSGLPVAQFQEISGVGANRWEFRKMAPTNLTCVFESEFRAGSTYVQVAEIPHRIEALDGLAVTLVLQGPLRRSYSSIYVDAHRSPPEPSRREVFTTSQLRERLKRLIDLLD